MLWILMICELGGENTVTVHKAFYVILLAGSAASFTTTSNAADLPGKNCWSMGQNAGKLYSAGKLQEALTLANRAVDCGRSIKLPDRPLTQPLKDATALKAENYRIRGLILRALGQADKAEADFKMNREVSAHCHGGC
jgi:hypothetical protein